MIGALVFAMFIASWWPCPERHSATVVNVVLRWNPWFGIMAFGPIVRNFDSGVVANVASWLALLDLLIVCGTSMIRASSLQMMWVDGFIVWLFWCSSLPLFCHYPRCPIGEDEMGKYGVSFVELLILFEVWLPRDWGPNTNALVGCWLSPSPSPFPPSSTPLLPPQPSLPGVQIRVEYKVPCSLLRSLATLEGGLARFVPCGLEKLTPVG